MSRETIIQNMISQLGQSQSDRLPPELAADFFAIDDDDSAKQCERLRTLASMMRFYGMTPDRASGDWTTFIPPALADLLERNDGSVTPHLALIGAFLELYRQPQEALNAFTGRHMHFQYRDVLRFEPKLPRPDRAHVVLELKKGVAPILVNQAQQFTAGKDADGIELIYRPVRDVVVGAAKVSALHSVYADADGVRFAPLANSADGLGAALDSALPAYRAFGHRQLPAAPVGFAFASPVLRMCEGTRKVTLSVELGDLEPSIHRAEDLHSAFVAHLSGAKGWLGPYPLSAQLEGNVLHLELTLPASDPAVADYQASVHGLALAAQAPVLQVLLEPNAKLRYADLRALSLRRARIRVDVKGVESLTLENDNGTLNPKKAFQPFGPQPVVGSRFMIGCEEALSKVLLDLKIALTWQAAPSNLSAHYANYKNQSRLNNGISAKMAFQDRSGQQSSTTLDLMLRDANGTTMLSPSAPGVTAQRHDAEFQDRWHFSLRHSGSRFGRWISKRRRLSHPHENRPTRVPPAPRAGFVTVALDEDFLHAEYRKELIERALAKSTTVANEPYTPTVSGIKLDYSAQSDQVDMSLTGALGQDSLANLDLHFFHVGPFGQRRDHAVLRENLAYVQDKVARLLPTFDEEGNFFIGLSQAQAGDAISLLIQVAPGSADPELAAPKVTWSVLCDNHWRTLQVSELALDSTNNFLVSGLIVLTLPAETDTDNTWMQSGLVWLRASLKTQSAAACEVVDVVTNAIEVAFVDNNNAPSHLESTLPPLSIAKLKSPIAAVKKVVQPFAGFGGRPRERDVSLTKRAAERLRHRQRCISPWDYERLLLEAFPEIHRIKCIPHASESSWLAPGHLLLVPIPDLRLKNAVDPLRPRVDLATLERIRTFAQAHAAMNVQIHARNPDYRRVRLDFKVRFRPGLSFNFYRGELEKAVIQVLAPWAFEPMRQVEFGGQIYRSVLLDVVEELEYVDFVSDFRMGIVAAGSTTFDDRDEISAQAPNVILVPDSSHSIAPIPT